MRNIPHRTYEEVYYDGMLDPFFEHYCEDTQEVVPIRRFLRELYRELNRDEWIRRRSDQHQFRETNANL